MSQFYGRSDPYEEEQQGGGNGGYETDDTEDIEEPFHQFKLKNEEFAGLVGNLAGDFLKCRLSPDRDDEGRSSDAASHFLGGGSGGGGNDLGNIIGNLAGQILVNQQKGSEGAAGDFFGDMLNTAKRLVKGGKGGGGGDGGGGGAAPAPSPGDFLGSLLGGGEASGGIDYGGLINQLVGGGKGGGGAGGLSPDAGKAPSTVKGFINDILKGQNIGNIIGGLIAGSGGKANRGTAGGDAGGGNIAMNRLKGGLIDSLSNLIGIGAQKFFGIDPQTGRIIGAIAGNALFNMGGKDNSLGQIGKAILDNIISGKFRRNVIPFRPDEPSEPKPTPWSRPEPEPTPWSRPEPEPYPRPTPPRPKPTPGPVEPSGAKSDFNKIRDDCLRNKQLYEDPDFPAEMSSLFFTRDRPEYRITWMRPGEICNEPQLFVEGHTRFDAVQGKLGDCWLLAATACLTLRDELFYRVVPPDQSFTENYAGIFHFQFWQYGKWVDVVIDDRLPCANNELLYMHSADNREFWSALLEKAYAKLYGSYEALKGGTTSEGLEDFTGGLTEFVDLKEAPPNLLQMIFTSFEHGSLLGCSIEADPRVFEARLPSGLVRGHAYSITGVKMVNGPRGEVPLLRIRNPWGNEQEWNGAWSDNSSEWRSISENDKQAIGLKIAHDGEFWMSYDDFMKNFEKLEICHLGPEVMDEIEQMTGAALKGSSWIASTTEGSWIRGRTAGGCRNFIKTFELNPQITFSIEKPDKGDSDGLCTIIIGLLQKYRREKKSKGLDMLPIGFAVYEAQGGGRLNTNYFASHKALARSPVFINLREICGRFRLPPGQYVIVPSTFEPDNEGDFMLRLFAQSESGLASEAL